MRVERVIAVFVFGGVTISGEGVVAVTAVLDAEDDGGGWGIGVAEPDA